MPNVAPKDVSRNSVSMLRNLPLSSNKADADLKAVTLPLNTLRLALASRRASGKTLFPVVCPERTGRGRRRAGVQLGRSRRELGRLRGVY